MGTYIGLRATIVVAGIGGLILGLAMLRYSPMMQMRHLPEPADAPVRTPEMAA